MEAEFSVEIKKIVLYNSKSNKKIYSKLDHLPEAAFNLCGTIDEAIEKCEKLLKEV